MAEEELFKTWVRPFISSTTLKELSEDMNYLPPEKAVPFAAPKVEIITLNGMMMLALAKTASPHVCNR